MTSKLVLAFIILMMTLVSCESSGTSDNSVSEESLLTESSSIQNSANVISEESVLSESAVEAAETAKGDTTDKIKTYKADHPVIEDIIWSVENHPERGANSVWMTVKNESDYIIRSFRLTFSEKKDITEEQKSAFFEEYKKFTWSSDEYIEELKKTTSRIEMYAESKTLLTKGEMVSYVDLFYFTRNVYMRSYDNYQLVEPDTAEIKYIDGEIMKKVYYDFKSGKYNMDSETEPVIKWVDYEIAERLPKIDAICLDWIRYDESNNDLCFEIEGMTFENYIEYVEMCKEKGFVNVISEYRGKDDDSNFLARDSEDYYLKIDYNKNRKEIAIMLYKNHYIPPESRE